MKNRSIQLSVIIPAKDEAGNLVVLLKRLGDVLKKMQLRHEVIVVEGGSRDRTASVARERGARVFTQKLRGYGGALKEGFQRARGDFILTLDADLTHEPTFLYRMWALREEAEVVIASRYVPGGVAFMPWLRRVLSGVLNRVYRRALSLPVYDLSSGFRLYRRKALQGLLLEGVHFDILEEILLKLYIRGYRVREIPFVYAPRTEGHSHASLFPFALSFSMTLYKLWKLRNTIEACDYDERAFHSTIPLQRYWQRERHRIVTEAIFKQHFVLDIGCGSSHILKSLPHGVGLDISFSKLRYMRSCGCSLVQASLFSLPFQDASFDGIICSEVIEHVPFSLQLFSEMARVLQPGGILVLGTPDYSRRTWIILEWLYKRLAPGGYADEHITHYTPMKLKDILKRYGFQFLQCEWIFSSEAILIFRKRS